MKKTTIIIKKEILEVDGEIVGRTLEQELNVEEVLPKYVVPTSNFTSCEDENVMLIGIPCRVLSKKPFLKDYEKIVPPFDKEKRPTVTVQSMVTGLIYDIPWTGWVKEYNSLAKANLEADIRGHYFPSLTDIIDRPYWPRHNDSITKVGEEETEYTFHNLYKKRCMIVSFPYRSKYKILGETRERWFINVYHKGVIYKVPFEEWAMTEPDYAFDPFGWY